MDTERAEKISKQCKQVDLAKARISILDSQIRVGKPIVVVSINENGELMTFPTEGKRVEGVLITDERLIEDILIAVRKHFQKQLEELEKELKLL